jgi:soluble lytic murein transglycosylase
MLKTRRQKILVITGAGLLALLAGGSFVVLHSSRERLPSPVAEQGQDAQSPQFSQKMKLSQDQSSPVLSLVTLPPGQRAQKLQTLAKGFLSTDQSRARYLLAVDLIQQDRGNLALPLLYGLEKSYPALAPYILLKQAQALASSGQAAQAEATYKDVAQRFPDSPATAEALYTLGKTKPQYWDQILQKFPAHPRSIEIAQTRLQKNPNQPQLLLLLVRHGLYLPKIGDVLDRLSSDYANQLSPDDWEAIAFGYWETQRYGRAGYAYAKAPATSLTLYRVARGAQLDERTQDAIQGYRTLIQTYPDADETGLALLRLSRLVNLKEAIGKLDEVISRFPDRAAEATLERAKVLDAMGSTKSASQARQSVLTQYSKSEAAAELRWTLTEQRMMAGDIQGAWEAAQQIVTENPDSKHAPEAAYWLGKWAQASGQAEQAKKTFSYILSRYPESYFAWRAAVQLGWDVGDFTTVRPKLPKVVNPEERPNLLAGSETLKELYQLGQDVDAWSQWQVEFKNVRQPTVAEQFTDGLMRLGVGNNLDGLFMVSSLSNREKSSEKTEYQILKQQKEYWQALYPFPFSSVIETWSEQRQLNPMLVTALIRQESRFEPKIQSSAGAVGLMQVMPDTADWIAKQIGVSNYKLDTPDDNLKLGTWYLNYTHEEYSDNSLLAVASYNAGPGNVADWLNRFGLSDPDWFVEQIPFAETKGYVEAVFENYWNYLRLYDPDIAQQLAQFRSSSTKAVNEASPSP